MTSNTHGCYMEQALALANSVLYTTDPNPRVGCVVVSQERIVGRGATSEVGGPHAEVNALRDAVAAARGATLYVTLEPCCHHGRTPPCTQLIIESGVEHVVVAMLDPNPLVAGGGIAALQHAGIRVTLLDEYARVARDINPGFVRRMSTGLPWVRVKLATSLDGRTALSDGESQWITGSEARQDVHHWRARSSAIVTGRGTIVHDDARLNARIDAPVVQPLRVVMTTSAQVPIDAAVLQPPQTCLIVASQMNAMHAKALEAQGVTCIELAGDQSGRVDPKAVIAELGQRAVNEVWVEAGATLSAQFILSGCVDELVVYLAPKLLGANARPMLDLLEPVSLAKAITFGVPTVHMVGDDVRLNFSLSGDA